MTFSKSNPRREFDYIEDRSCMRSQFSCLCGTGSCRLCCRSFPPVKESNLTRIVYILCLVISTLFMAIFITEEVQQIILRNLPNDFAVCEFFGAGKGCHGVHLMGYIIVYRIGFALTLYHIVLMFATYGVRSSKDCRAGLHNGMWIYKFMLFIFLCILSFSIPDRDDYFLNGWMYTAMVGAAVFIVIQMIILVFVAHSWTDKIQNKVETGGSAFFWYVVAAPTISIMTFAICGVAICLLYIYFASDEACHQNQWFILCNAGGCFIASVVAGLKKDSKPVGLRLMHAALVSLYVIYMTWNAISSAPRKFQRYSSRSYSRTRQHYEFASRQNYYCGPNAEEPSVSDFVIPYVSFVITIITVIYGSIVCLKPTHCQNLELPGCPRQQLDKDYERDDTGGQIVIRNEKKTLRYSYALFHLMMSLACLLLMMHLTAWFTPNKSSLMHFGRSWSAVWIKMTSCWVCIIIYFITVVCPSVLPGNKPVIPTEESLTVEVNGHAFEVDDSHSQLSEAESFDECAVPLAKIHRPYNFRYHQETTV